LGNCHKRYQKSLKLSFFNVLLLFINNFYIFAV
jgi:hypothetical protein